MIHSVSLRLLRAVAVLLVVAIIAAIVIILTVIVVIIFRAAVMTVVVVVMMAPQVATAVLLVRTTVDKELCWSCCWRGRRGGGARSWSSCFGGEHFQVEHVHVDADVLHRIRDAFDFLCHGRNFAGQVDCVWDFLKAQALLTFDERVESLFWVE
jgi:hypothetical protein